MSSVQKAGGKTGRNDSQKASNQNGIDPRYVTAYAWYRAGVPISEICRKYRRGKSIIYRWIAQVKAIVETPINPAELKNMTIGLFPLALEGLTANLRKKKEVTVNNFLNKTIFADVKDYDSSSTTNVLNLGLGLERPLTADEVAFLEEIRRLLGERDQEKPTPPLGSRF